MIRLEASQMFHLGGQGHHDSVSLCMYLKKGLTPNSPQVISPQVASPKFKGQEYRFGTPKSEMPYQAERSGRSHQVGVSKGTLLM